MVLISCLLLVLSFLWNVNGNMNTTSTPYATVAGLVVGLLDEEMKNEYNLSAIPNIYDWNLTKILLILNHTAPNFLYKIQTNVLVQFLPPYLVEHLPQSVLAYHHLCQYLPKNYSGCGNATNASSTIDPCVGYLINSNIDNPVKSSAPPAGFNVSLKSCGLRCNAGGLAYGLSASDQHTLNVFKSIGTVICFVTILIIFVNQILDQKYSREKFLSKPLLYHCPYVITFASFVIVACMTISELIGTDTIVCNNDGSFTFWSPKSGNQRCTVHGLFFYSAVLYFEFYTMLLSFCIFRQFQKPIKPLWGIANRWWHLLVTCGVLLFDIVALSINAFDGISPMGVCFPGAAEQSQIFGFTVFPTAFSCIFTATCLGLALMLIKRTIKTHEKNVSKESTNSIQDLSVRLAMYCTGVLITLVLLSITAFVFYAKQSGLKSAFIQYVQCDLFVLAGITSGPCVQTDSLNVFWFMTWILCSMFAALAQLALSCHITSRDRLKRMTTQVTSQMKDAIEKLEVSRVSSKQRATQNKVVSASPRTPRSTSGSNNFDSPDDKNEGKLKADTIEMNATKTDESKQNSHLNTKDDLEDDAIDPTSKTEDNNDN